MSGNVIPTQDNQNNKCDHDKKYVQYLGLGAAFCVMSSIASATAALVSKVVLPRLGYSTIFNMISLTAVSSLSMTALKISLCGIFVGTTSAFLANAVLGYFHNQDKPEKASAQD